MACFGPHNFSFSSGCRTHSRILLLYYRKLCTRTHVYYFGTSFLFSYVIPSYWCIYFLNRTYGCRVLPSYIILAFAGSVWQYNSTAVRFYHFTTASCACAHTYGMLVQLIFLWWFVFIFMIFFFQIGPMTVECCWVLLSYVILTFAGSVLQ